MNTKSCQFHGKHAKRHLRSEEYFQGAMTASAESIFLVQRNVVETALTDLL